MLYKILNLLAGLLMVITGVKVTLHQELIRSHAYYFDFGQYHAVIGVIIIVVGLYMLYIALKAWTKAV